MSYLHLPYLSSCNVPTTDISGSAETCGRCFPPDSLFCHWNILTCADYHFLPLHPKRQKTISPSRDLWLRHRSWTRMEALNFVSKCHPLEFLHLDCPLTLQSQKRFFSHPLPTGLLDDDTHEHHNDRCVRQRCREYPIDRFQVE